MSDATNMGGAQSFQGGAASPTGAQPNVPHGTNPQSQPGAANTAVPQSQQVEPAKPAPYEDRFQALSKKQKEFHEQQKSFAQRQREIEEKEKMYALLDENPAEFFQKRGKDFNEVLRKMAGEDQPVESKVEMLQKKLEDYERREKEREERLLQDEQSKEFQKQVAEFKTSVKTEVSADLDRWEAINKTESFDDVFEVCKQYYDTHGDVPPVEWAADQVENFLVEQGKKFQGLKKLTPTQQVAAGLGNSEQKPFAPTLNNNFTPEPQGSNNNKLLSEDESKANAARLLKWS